LAAVRRPRAAHRILLVAHAYPGDSAAGVETYTERLALELQRRGREVAVACGRIRPGRAQNSVVCEKVNDISVLGIVQNWPYRDLPEAVSDPALDRVFGSLLDERRPDLVAIQSLQGLSAGFVAEAARRCVPVVMHLHDAWASCASGGQRLHPDGATCLPLDERRCPGCWDRYRHREGPLEQASRWVAARLPGVLAPDTLHRAWLGLPGPLRQGLRRVNERGARMGGRGRGRGRDAARGGGRAAGAADPRFLARRSAVAAAMRALHGVISPTRFQLESLRDDGVPLPRRTAVVGTGVPGERAAATVDPGGPLRVLFLGTWVPHKGPQVLAEALALLSSQDAARIDARALGPDPFPAWKLEVLRRAGGRLRDGGLARGAVAVQAELAAADLVVLPSIWPENAPLVALEARAAGRPLLASRAGGLPEIVEDGRDGLLLPPGDARALATQLARLALDRPAFLGLAARVEPPRNVGDWVDEIERSWSAMAAAVPGDVAVEAHA
jgi:glycosyltransferase involved in cell wall biosynthesis